MNYKNPKFDYYQKVKCQINESFSIEFEIANRKREAWEWFYWSAYSPNFYIENRLTWVLK